MFCNFIFLYVLLITNTQQFITVESTMKGIAKVSHREASKQPL